VGPVTFFYHLAVSFLFALPFTFRSFALIRSGVFLTNLVFTCFLEVENGELFLVVLVIDPC